MLINRAYKFRLLPDKEQASSLKRHIGCSRYAFNWALDKKKLFYEQNKKTLPYAELSRLWTQHKREHVDLPYELIEEIPELRAAQTAIAKKNTGAEFIAYKLSDLPAHQRFYIALLAGNLAEKVGHERDFPEICTLQTHVNRLLGDGRGEVGYDGEAFESYGPEVGAYVKDLIDSLPKNESRALLSHRVQTLTKHGRNQNKRSVCFLPVPSPVGQWRILVGNALVPFVACTRRNGQKLCIYRIIASSSG